MMVQGFRFAGLHAGIKPRPKDLALVVSDVPACAAPAASPSTAPRPRR